MAGITVSRLSFTYPQETVPRPAGRLVFRGGGRVPHGHRPSGGGKSTLLRALKPALTPHGSFTGEISFFGEPLSALDARRQAAEIGFVLQKPDEQIVTDRVWHELAFGMESLGLCHAGHPPPRGGDGELFGIEEWFSRPVEALSGGQKQLLNLASVMALQPRVLLLDEPTSQLDPIGGRRFPERRGAHPPRARHNGHPERAPAGGSPAAVRPRAGAGAGRSGQRHAAGGQPHPARGR